MNAGHVILGRPWLFDMDVTLWRKSNICTFNHEGQLIKLILSQPKSKQSEKKSVETKKEKNLNLISPKEIKKEVINGTQIIVLVARNVAKVSHETILPAMAPIITDFADMFLKDLPGRLPLMRNIQYAIDLIPGATMPNLPIIEWTR